MYCYVQDKRAYWVVDLLCCGALEVTITKLILFTLIFFQFWLPHLSVFATPYYIWQQICTLQCFRATWAPLCRAAIARCLRGLRGYLHKINPFLSYFFPVLIAASFSVCYALLSLTTDALAMLALQRRNRELLLPWLIWYILDMGKKNWQTKIDNFHFHEFFFFSRKSVDN